MNAYEIPGYVQGHRFSDEDSVFFDSATNTFKDLSGYGDFLNVEPVVGTPSFQNFGPNSRRGLLLDNTYHGRFIPMAPWETTIVFAIYIELLTSGTITKYPYLFGNASLPTNNGFIKTIHFSGNRRINSGTPSAQSNIISQTLDGIIVGAFAFDQSTREIYDTQDGVTVNSTTAVTDNGNGTALAIGSGQAVGFDGIYCRLGDLNGDGSTTAETDLKIAVMESHFFSGNAIANYPSQIQTLLADISSYYGV